MGDAAEDRAKAAELPEGDVIAVLLEQHAQIKDLFAEVKRANGPDKKEKFDALRALLAVHETAEELVLRPVSAELAGQDVVDARNREEADANAVLADLEGMDVESPEFDIRLEAFRKAVDEHAEAEEKDEFPEILAGCDEERRRDLGRKIKAAEAIAPTHLHPESDPGSTKQKLVGPFASMVDRVRDAISKAV
ncbi:Hemerythrin HHE cation binding domain-containing protein [Nocardioides terrae]|uniref:Hemerythrin HHE cation binding domain-containing protein n=1 Tax=Nocardioides terrae TaxID=574651 RepID=A0A1I1ICT6_9ACTN|nr:hemerythrin domain-containing protein [Nocardioides terrae]SFC33482.1 Hemerythrin HHE cation binding domain-containing protein [Nocardioides terrae]